MVCYKYKHCYSPSGKKASLEVGQDFGLYCHEYWEMEYVGHVFFKVQKM